LNSINGDNIFNLLDNTKLNADATIRKETQGGTIGNFEKLTETQLSKSELLYITLVIDRNNDKTTVYVESDTIGTTQACVLNEAIPADTNILANFFSDHINSKVGFDEFTIDYSCQNEVMCDDYDYTCDDNHSEFVALTPENHESCIADAHLVNDHQNTINADQSRWECSQDGNTLCAYLDIKDRCDCFSTIKIGISGEVMQDDVDLYSVFSFTDDVTGNDKYFSILNNWNGQVGIYGGSPLGNGGVFIAPMCGSDSFLTYDNSNGDDIFNLLDMSSLVNEELIRHEPADNDLNNYERITANRVALNEDLFITLEIDRLRDTTTVYFETNTIGKTEACVINEAIPADTNIIANFFSDHKNSQVGFEQFTVEYDCNDW